MSHHITITAPHETAQRYDEITLEQVIKRRAQRKRRVAKRLYKRAPLFAAEFMCEEFPETTQADVIEAVSRPTRKRKSQRTKKNGLKRYGRYPLYEKALHQYYQTGDLDALAEAQRWRNRLALDFEFYMRCQGQSRIYRLAPTASL